MSVVQHYHARTTHNYSPKRRVSDLSVGPRISAFSRELVVVVVVAAESACRPNGLFELIVNASALEAAKARKDAMAIFMIWWMLVVLFLASTDEE